MIEFIPSVQGLFRDYTPIKSEAEGVIFIGYGITFLAFGVVSGIEESYSSRPNTIRRLFTDGYLGIGKNGVIEGCKRLLPLASVITASYLFYTHRDWIV